MRHVLTAMALTILAGVVTAAEYRFPLTSENTKVEWTGTKPEGKHDGGFKKVNGVATLADGAGLKIELDVDTTSLYSDNEKLTAHLKSPDFFAVKTNPKARFVSTKIEKAATGYNVTGNLTLLGKTKEVTFPADIRATDKLTIRAKFPINRNDFGMSYGKGKISDDVEIRVAVDAAR